MQEFKANSHIAMSDSHVDRWMQRGRVFLWSYAGNPRNFCGWHITADDAGCESLLLLIDLMIQAEFKAKQIIDLTPPTASDLRVVGCTARAMAAKSLNLSHSKQRMAMDHWSLRAADRTVDLEAGKEHLEKLRKGIEDIRRGEGDYLIGIDGEELWFWWRPDCGS